MKNSPVLPLSSFLYKFGLRSPSGTFSTNFFFRRKKYFLIQFLMLIPNMILVLLGNEFLIAKQMSKNSAQMHFLIVFWIFDHQTCLLKIEIVVFLVELKKFYRLGQKRKGEEMDLIKSQDSFMTKSGFSYILSVLLDLFALVAHFFRPAKQSSFVELQKFYRLGQKRKVEEIALIKSQDSYMTKSGFSYILSLLLDLFALVAHFFRPAKQASFVELQKFYRLVWKRNGEEAALI